MVKLSTRLFLSLIIFLFILSSTHLVCAQPDNITTVELNGDTIEYAKEKNIVISKGNVVIVYGDATLYSDYVEFHQDTNIAHASGHVRLVTPDGEIAGEHVVYNFNDKTGEFNGVRFYTHPYYGHAKKARKMSDEKLILEDGFVTTSDYDKPEYRITSRRIEVYPGNKIVARPVRLKFGAAPLFYLPRWTHHLDENKPKWSLTPGYDSEWGAFLLAQYRTYLTDNVRTTIHLDYRERRDFASGFDLDYTTKNFGAGIFKAYYMNERDLGNNHLWDEREQPTPERERYRVQWRHKWDIDEDTQAIWQYYKLSDNQFLRDYFESENERESSPDTYFLVTKSLPKGTLSLETDVRVNRFTTEVERLPEVRYTLPNTEIGESNLYYENTTSVSRLTKKFPSPTEVNLQTTRVDTSNHISYPMKVNIFEVTPFVGMRHTYYRETNDPDKYDSIRGIFETGASLQTKFYRVYDAYTDMWGLDINRLRHIITPSLDYFYRNQPTINYTALDQYDEVDAIQSEHGITLSLENKLQTKRDDKSVDLVRAKLSIPYRLKQDYRDSGFDILEGELEITPLEWLGFYVDADYDTKDDHLETANFDVYINDQYDKWSLTLGKRYDREVDDQLTGEWTYRLNPKWAFRVYERINLDTGNWREHEYTITRDLHSWEMDFNINHTKGRGDEFLIIFRLKAFPDVGIDVGTTLNEPKRGAN